MTFTLELTAQDLGLATEGTDLMAAAEESSKRLRSSGGSDRLRVSHNGIVDSYGSATVAAAGVLPGGETSRPEIPPLTAILDQSSPQKEISPSLLTPPGGTGTGERGVCESLTLMESEAWERVAREVRKLCKQQYRELKRYRDALFGIGRASDPTGARTADMTLCLGCMPYYGCRGVEVTEEDCKKLPNENTLRGHVLPSLDERGGPPITIYWYASWYCW